jgi:hypothetical protein
MAADTTANAKTNARATTRKAASTKRSTTAKKGAATRANKRTTAATKRTTTSAKRTTKSAAQTTQASTRATAREASTGIDRVGDVAERAMLTYVGAALAARDSVRDLRTTYTSRAEVEKGLRRFERRGTTARNSLEREVKRTRTKVERRLRQRRDSLSKVVNVSVPAPEALAKNARAQADLASARVGNAVETAQLAGATVVAKVAERVASLA